MRILVATDNHIGYMEKDAVRGDDSFAAFNEVLCTAKAKRVDFVVFAGDLYHENKPSRHSLHNSMQLLRKYCQGDEPVFTEILNDQEEVFKSNGGSVNYENPYQSISLPVYAIHGNHDDPSREGGQNSESLAALDLLAVTNLVNYFGKADQVDDIEIVPVLIRKGSTHIALYGLGNVRDERLNRMWNQKKVRFVRPSSEQGRERFFNIFVLHQNRDYGRGIKNCIHESMIPEWMDLVIWGNEHEAIPRLVESLVGTYRIYQPGSSISTSLSESESSAHPKSMGLIEIRSTKEFRMKAYPFSQVRPFKFDEIDLSDPDLSERLDPTDPKIEEKIKKVLTAKVREMIEDAKTELARIEAAPESLDFRIKDPHIVLIRLKVDHAGFPTINPVRFGSQFMGMVANPSEILVFSRKAKSRAGTGAAAEGVVRGEIAQQIRNYDGPGDEEIHKIKIEDLVAETLSNSKKQLSLLPEANMAEVNGKNIWAPNQHLS